jgi:leucine dehydrogenase
MSQKHALYHTGFSGAKLVANGEVSEQNKQRLLSAVGIILNSHKGKIYTGCDLNISQKDMDYLYTMTPYILSSLGSNVNTSTATAFGVYGSIMAAMQYEGAPTPQTILLHGCGKVGTEIAKKLIADGHQVLCFDVNPDAANIHGAHNISGNADWYKVPLDYLVLCSKSGLIDANYARQLACRWIVSSANAPFTSDAVHAVLADKCTQWIPDVVSNAGAVICDSIEFYSPQSYKTLQAEQLYQFVFQAKFNKTQALLQEARRLQLLPYQVLDLFFAMDKCTSFATAQVINQTQWKREDHAHIQQIT